MTKEYIATRTKFTPAPGKVYRNTSGFCYRCMSVSSNKTHTATMCSEAGWLFQAHGCGMYEDGKIDWDYSTGGQFV